MAVKSCPAAVTCSKRDAECAGGSFTVNPAQLHERLFTASSSQQLQRKAQWWQVSSSSGSHTFSETRSSWSRRVAAAGRRSPRRAPLLADAVILAARVSVGRRATGASLLPSVRHGVALRARPRLWEETECTCSDGIHSGDKLQVFNVFQRKFVCFLL